MQSDLAGTRAVQKVLKARQPQSAGWNPSQPPETVAWQPALESLASAMPRQAWLTALRYQPPSLILTGYTPHSDALRHDRCAERVTGLTRTGRRIATG
ncbi:MAG: hypothetical protein ACLR9W_00380 [Enterobacter hormaechei]